MCPVLVWGLGLIRHNYHPSRLKFMIPNYWLTFKCDLGILELSLAKSNFHVRYNKNSLTLLWYNSWGFLLLLTTRNKHEHSNLIRLFGALWVDILTVHANRTRFIWSKFGVGLVLFSTCPFLSKFNVTFHDCILPSSFYRLLVKVWGLRIHLWRSSCVIRVSA